MKSVTEVFSLNGSGISVKVKAFKQREQQLQEKQIARRKVELDIKREKEVKAILERTNTEPLEKVSPLLRKKKTPTKKTKEAEMEDRGDTEATAGTKAAEMVNQICVLRKKIKDGSILSGYPLRGSPLGQEILDHFRDLIADDEGIWATHPKLFRVYITKYMSSTFHRYSFEKRVQEIKRVHDRLKMEIAEKFDEEAGVEGSAEEHGTSRKLKLAMLRRARQLININEMTCDVSLEFQLLQRKDALGYYGEIDDDGVGLKPKTISEILDRDKMKGVRDNDSGKDLGLTKEAAQRRYIEYVRMFTSNKQRIEEEGDNWNYIISEDIRRGLFEGVPPKIYNRVPKSYHMEGHMAFLLEDPRAWFVDLLLFKRDYLLNYINELMEHPMFTDLVWALNDVCTHFQAFAEVERTKRVRAKGQRDPKQLITAETNTRFTRLFKLYAQVMDEIRVGMRTAVNSNDIVLHGPMRKLQLINSAKRLKAVKVELDRSVHDLLQDQADIKKTGIPFTETNDLWHRRLGTVKKIRNVQRKKRRMKEFFKLGREVMKFLIRERIRRRNGELEFTKWNKMSVRSKLTVLRLLHRRLEQRLNLVWVQLVRTLQQNGFLREGDQLQREGRPETNFEFNRRMEQEKISLKQTSRMLDDLLLTYQHRHAERRKGALDRLQRSFGGGNTLFLY